MVFPCSEDKPDEEDFTTERSANSRNSVGQMTGLKPKILVFDSPEKGKKTKLYELIAHKLNFELGKGWKENKSKNRKRPYRKEKNQKKTDKKNNTQAH